MKGFTLVETILVLALLVIISSFSIPFVQSFNASSNLYTYADQLEKFVRKAQDQAASGLNGSAWGIYFNDAMHEAVLYQGESYILRDADYDLRLAYPTGYTITTDFGTDLNFSVYAGTPDAAGVVSIVDSNSQTRNFSINELGLIK